MRASFRLLFAVPVFLFGCVGDAPVGPSGGDGGGGDGGTLDAASDQSSEPAPAVPLTGTVVNLFNEPVSGAEVWIGATKVVTKGDGTFTIDAPPVYDASVVINGSPTRLMSFVGLTSRTPVLQAGDGAASGTASGAGNVLDSTMAWPPPSTSGVTATFSTDKGAAVSTHPTFSGKNMSAPSFPYGRSTTSVTGTAYVLRYTLGATPTGLPEKANATTGVMLAGSGSYTATNGGTAAPTVQLGTSGNDFNHRPLTLTFTLPPNTTPLEMAALLDVPPDTGRIVIKSSVDAINNTEFDTPTNIGAGQAKAGAAVHARHTDRREIWAWQVGLTSTGTVNLTPPPPVDLTAPAAAGTISPQGELSWDGTGRTGAFYFVAVKCGTAFEGGILTLATKVTLPSAGAAGPSGGCNWSVRAVTSAQSTDDLVSPAGGIVG